MREGWEIKNIGSICDIRTGKLDANASVEHGTYPFFTCSKEVLRIDNYAYDCECVLIAGNGDLNVKYYNGRFNAYQRTYIISLKKDIKDVCVKYIYKYFEKYIEKLRQLSVGGVIKYIKLGDITGALLYIPPLPEQQKIVEELDYLSNMIELKKKQLETYDKLAQSIFYDMFGAPITNEKGWEVKKLIEVCPYITDGSHYSPKEKDGGTIPMLSVKDMTKAGFSYEQCKMIGKDEYSKLLNNGCKPLKGDVLVAKDGSYFKYIFSLKEEREQALLSSIAIVRPNMRIINDCYLVGYLSTPQIYDKVEREYLTGTAIKRVILKGIRQLEILVPPLSLQQQFAEKIEAIERQKELIKQTLKSLEELFNSRMDYYFN